MHQSSATEPEARQLIDLERYPILDPTSDAGCALLEFLAAVLQVAEIHRYADPLGACKVAVMVDGDCLEWHLDQTDTMPMTPGTLLLFQGRHSIRRVTPVRGETPRLVALLAYDTRPGTCASELLQRARYGRALRPGA